mgnify:CR=1 FL=1
MHVFGVENRDTLTHKATGVTSNIFFFVIGLKSMVNCVEDLILVLPLFAV